MWEIKKFQDFCLQDMESCHIAAQWKARETMVSNANLFFEEPHQLTKFA